MPPKKEKSNVLTGLDLFDSKSIPASGKKKRYTPPLIPVQEALVIQGVLAGKKPGEAVVDAGYGFSSKNAKTFGENLIKKHTDVNGALIASLESVGVDLNFITGKIKEGMGATKALIIARTKEKDGTEQLEYVDAPDFATRHKYVETILDILPGARAAKKIEVTQTTFEQKAVLVADMRENPADVMAMMQRMLEQKRTVISE